MIIVDDIFIGVQPGTYSKVAIAVRDGHYCVVCKLYARKQGVTLRSTTKMADNGCGLPTVPRYDFYASPTIYSISSFVELCNTFRLPEYAIPEAVALML